MKVVTQLLDNHDQKSVSSATEPNRISSNILTTLPVTQDDKKNITSTYTIEFQSSFFTYPSNSFC